MGFRQRLTLFFVLIVVLPMVALAVLFVQATTTSQTGKADARLAAGLEASLTLYGDAQRAAERLATEVVAPGTPLANALASGESARVRRAAARTVTDLGLEYLRIVESGEQLASVGTTDPVAVIEAQIDLPAGRTATLSLATTSATKFVAEASRITGRDAALIVDDREIAATVPLEGVEIPPEQQASTVELGGTERRVATSGLEGVAGGEARIALFGPIDSGGFVATRPLVAAALAVFFAAALFFIIVVLRSLQGQVTAMLTAARRIGEGDFEHEVPVEGRDEMAGLAEEFNKMSRQLALQMGELRRQRDQLDESVRRIGEAFVSGLDRTALLEVVAETALTACNAQYGRISVPGAVATDIQKGAPPSAALREVIAEAESGARRTEGPARSSHGDAHALAHPLVRPGEPEFQLGIVAIGRSGDEFGEREAEALRYLAGQAAVSIENVGLHELVAEQAVTDELTRLPNLRAFADWMVNEIERVERFGHELSLLMVDLDDFKQINDTYGHLQGDEVLRVVGRILRRESRGVDEPARYGGEEFVLALPETGIEGALEVAERVRARIEESQVRVIDSDQVLKLTASIGAATIPTHAGDQTGLLAAADEALYRAKSAGKNRVVAAEGSAPRPPAAGNGGSPAGDPPDGAPQARRTPPPPNAADAIPAERPEAPEVPASPLRRALSQGNRLRRRR